MTKTYYNSQHIAVAYRYDNLATIQASMWKKNQASKSLQAAYQIYLKRLDQENKLTKDTFDLLTYMQSKQKASP